MREKEIKGECSIFYVDMCECDCVCMCVCVCVCVCVCEREREIESSSIYMCKCVGFSMKVCILQQISSCVSGHCVYLHTQWA